MLAIAARIGENYTYGILLRRRAVSVGLTDRQGNLLDDVERFCAEALAPDSIYAFLHREREALFPDESFADLFHERGRRSVPPSVVAVVMVLQRLEGLSDREAAERYCFDNRWRYAAGAGGYDTGSWRSFAHTVLVDMRERLRRSARPDRVFEVALEAAKAAGVVGRRRVLDSTPLYDAVATMDTITLVRSAVRGLLKVADAKLRAELVAAMASGDDYACAAKPQIDWEDEAARTALVDSRAKDGYACLVLLHGREPDEAVHEAARLLATVLGQDLEEGEGDVLRTARRVAPDRVISTVDPEARHGHKTAARGFDGYKGHAAVDPDSEIITATAVTPGNAGDASVAADLIADLLGKTDEEAEAGLEEPEAAANAPETSGEAGESAGEQAGDRPAVYGDNAYGTGEFQQRLEEAGIDSRAKTQRPTAPDGRFGKDRFAIDLGAGTVTCPAGVTVTIRRRKDGAGVASFGGACADCPQRQRCTGSATGRVVNISRHEKALAAARARQAGPAWQHDYRSTRPKVERKLAHLMRRKHGGRRARVRGKLRVAADFSLLAAAQNLARLARLGLRSGTAGWTVA